MDALESSFVAFKRDHAFHNSIEQDVALKCATLEALIADADDQVNTLGGDSHKLAEALDVAEASVGPQRLAKAREIRQIEMINGARDPLLAASSSSSRSTAEQPAEPPPLTRDRQQSWLSTFEEHLLNKVAF